MKKSILFFAIAAMTFVSCKKETIEPTPTPTPTPTAEFTNQTFGISSSFGPDGNAGGVTFYKNSTGAYHNSNSLQIGAGDDILFPCRYSLPCCTYLWRSSAKV